jgi:crotonobetainyl-CoA:carnitine CoA-transferase CaiB-like acyl-CoA transferase
VAPRLAPALGEHSDEILREIGFTPDRIASLRAGGAIPKDKPQATAA